MSQHATDPTAGGAKGASTGRGTADADAHLPGIPHREFLERALAAGGEWTRYSDPKALGVLVLLGLGVKDLIDHAGRFAQPHEPAAASCGLINAVGHSCSGIAATGAFLFAGVLAAGIVGLVTRALFSRMTLRGLVGQEKDDTVPQSRFFFGEVRRYDSQDEYAEAVLEKKQHELLRDIAGQVYEVACICQTKHAATQRAYLLTVDFLIAWVAGRIFLSSAS